MTSNAKGGICHGIKETYKTFSCVIHEAELETLLVFKSLGQCMAQRV